MDIWSKWQKDLPSTIKFILCTLTTVPDVLIQLSNATSLSIGVTDWDPNIPVFSKYAVNITDSEEQRYVYCFTDFASEAPPYLTFDIPDTCQLSSSKAVWRDPWNIKHNMVEHMQQQMKLNGRTLPQLWAVPASNLGLEKSLKHVCIKIRHFSKSILALAYT